MGLGKELKELLEKYGYIADEINQDFHFDDKLLIKIIARQLKDISFEIK